MLGETIGINTVKIAVNIEYVNIGFILPSESKINPTMRVVNIFGMVIICTHYVYISEVYSTSLP